MKVDSIWVTSTLAQSALKQKHLCSLWSLDTGAVSRTLSGSRAIKPSEASQFALATGESLSMVLHKFGHDVDIESGGQTYLELTQENIKLQILVDALVAKIGGSL